LARGRGGVLFRPNPLAPFHAREWGKSPPRFGEVNLPRVGPRALANPEPTRVGKRGGPGGLWRVSPHKTLKGASCQPLQPRHGWGPKPRQTFSLRGWARGSRGHSPLAGGLGDVPPKTKRGGELPTPVTTPRVGPRALANPEPTRVGKRGGPGWLWRVSPTKP
jgi:hypothetical protein